MPKYIESNISFDFDSNTWEHVIEFDKHPYYFKIEKLDKTKGVDFLAVNSNKLCLIEVKNFKFHRIDNKYRLTQGGNELMNEVALKIRDSLACIVAANRNSTNDKIIWDNTLRILADKEKEVIVILWLEKDLERRKPSERRQKVKSYDYKRTLHNKLKWLIPTRSGINVLNKTNFYDKKLNEKLNFEVAFDNIENK
jgi:hypothetical protein